MQPERSPIASTAPLIRGRIRRLITAVALPGDRKRVLSLPGRALRDHVRGVTAGAKIASTDERPMVTRETRWTTRRFAPL